MYVYTHAHIHVHIRTTQKRTHTMHTRMPSVGNSRVRIAICYVLATTQN